MSWTEQDRLAALDGKQRGRGRIRTRDITTGRVRSWPVPGAINPNLYVVHTRRHVFLDKLGSGLRANRYAIDLSQAGGAARTRLDG